MSNETDKKDSSDRRTGAAMRCICPCVIPGVGLYEIGDIVTDEALIEKLKDHPYFTPQAHSQKEK